MYIAPDSGKPLWHSLLAQVKDGTIPMARLHDAVTRILRVKMRLGLFEAGKPSSRLLSGKYDGLAIPEHRAIPRQAGRESLVTLKNNGGGLPLNTGDTLSVAGERSGDAPRHVRRLNPSWQRQ